MAELNDFVETQEYSIEDFTDPSAVQPPVTSLGSDRSAAAHAAMLSPEPANAIQAYDQIVGERASTGTSDTEEALVTNARGENMLAYQRSTAELLMDPSASQEWKAAAIGVVNDPNSTLYDPRTMVATKAATQKVDSETQEAALQRGIAAAGINEVLEFQREKQKHYNSMQLVSDKDKTADWVSTAEGFIPLASGYKEARITRDLAGNDWSTFRTAMATIFNGKTVKERNEMFNSLPINQRMQMMDKIADIISTDGQTIFLPSSRDTVNLKAFMQTVESDGYSTTEETVDNILGVLDFAGVGSMVRTGANYVTKLGKLAGEADTVSDSFRNVVRTNVTTDVQPTSLHNTVKDVNPQMGRNLYNATLTDESGELATAVYGTSREDAIASVVAPKPATVDGTVASAISHPELESDFGFMPDADILDFVDNSGAAWLTQSEKRVLRSSVVNDFRNAVGMVNRKEMGSVESLPDGVRFSSVYGPTDNGWSGLQEAVDQAQFALKNYGVTENEISVLVRQGDNYVPLDKKVQATLMAGNNPQIKGDYLLQIDHTYKYDSSKLSDGFEFLDVRNNGFDRWLPGGGKIEQGTIQSNVLDPQSMLNPKLTKGATIASLRTAGLEQKLLQGAKDYVESLQILPSARQERIFSKIRENNVKGQGLNYANLKAEGFTDNEVDVLAKWQKNQDTLYAISNRDMIKTYTSRGYGLMEHPDSGTRLIVRPVARNQTGDRVKAYDPLTDSVVDLDAKALTDLYAGNGNVAKSISPINVDGVNVEHVLNRNAAGSTYIRKMRNDDQVLNYRKGYYAVRYRNPHFIERKVVDADGKPVLDSSGKEMWKAVATASDIPKAKKAVERLTTTTGGEYRFRNDLKGEDFDNASHAVLQTGGMSSQRLRGERLEEALGDNQLLSDATHIESPIESMVHAMQSVSSRVSTRDWLETAKQRFIAQYGDVLPKKQGQTVYPATRSEIGEAGNKRTKMAADARTTWEYIRAMEDGYKNSLDDGAKALLNGIAEWMGHKGFGLGERAARAVGEQADITGKLKGAAFTMYLAANPIRQLLVQSHQILMLGSLHPQYVFSQLPRDLMVIMAYHAGAKPSKALLKASGRTEAEANAMFKALKDSNIGAGITKNELVSESMNSLVDEASRFARTTNKVSKYTTRPIQQAIALSRKVGFDFGEYLSSASAFLTEYDKAIKSGIKMDATAIEDITTRSRNLVYNMDRAGALPYNHNSAALVTQFLQVPHKAILQFTANRGLSPMEKGKILGYMFTMFGTTSLGFGSIVEAYTRDLLPDDPTYREILVNGLETVVLNKVFSELYGEQVGIDFSSLAPLDVYGVSEFLGSVLDSGPLEIFAASPAGSLIAGSNPRVATLLNTAATMVGLKDPAEGMSPPSWSNLAKDSANLFSGLSNAFKAQYAWEYGKKLGALGGTTDTNVNKVEAIAAALGLPTQDETKYRKAMEAVYKNDKEIEKDVKELFRLTSIQMAQDDIDASQYEYVSKMMGQGMTVFKGNPKALQYWKAEMKKQSTNRDNKFIRQMMDYSGWGTPDKVKSLIDNAPLDAERKGNLKAFVDYQLETRQDIKE
ncbi:hypothetical protein [Citrobacter phage CVT22]|uniref:Uncharacterized protein n=1 Tax=Citrobacter phage CVT22 TaxID=1622234 RepID=A0A0R6CHJ1_9CAUD|nr:hypothetical protein APL39_gp14 [Citrobacter phage CVT22]AJT60719.1 hypothetical protein [Citrobacter phage CVT22]